MYTYAEILDYVQQEDIRFVRLIFSDLSGREKCVTILPDELERAFTEGISFDGSAVAGYGSPEESDCFLRPDPSTMAPVPWHPMHGRMIRFYCDVCGADGRPLAADARTYLTGAVAAAEAQGLRLRIGTEFEFYVFRTDEQGRRTTDPFDSAGYMDIDPGDKCEALRREICFTLRDMGICPESAHHEEGPGQNEIDFRPADPVTAADNAVTFQSVVRTIATRSGLYASFYPKPLAERSGNGLHVNLSLQSADGAEHFDAFLAGILDHAAELTAFFNPTEESYRRLGEKKAPGCIAWGPGNRSALIRVPAASRDRRRLELRSPDAGMNPYLGFALVIYAGLDGIARGLTPPPPVTADLYTDAAQRAALQKLPETLDQARAAAKASPWLKTVLPPALMQF